MAQTVVFRKGCRRFLGNGPLRETLRLRQRPEDFLKQLSLRIIQRTKGVLDIRLRHRTRATFGRVSELTVWEDYVAGTNPTNLNSVFRSLIDMSGDTPKISWNPDLNENGAKHERDYQIWGAKSLDGQRFKVDGDEGAYNFFKVTVEWSFTSPFN